MLNYTLRWSAVWRSGRFRRMAVGGLVLVAGLLAIWPWYLQNIEKRKGVILNDWLLDALPLVDVSLPIFAVLWASAGLLIWRAWRYPQVYLEFIWSYGLLFLLRIVTIGAVALDPPPDLIVLTDPISNYFYGPTFITKDLFFSGHTASLCLMAFCLPKRSDRWLVGIGALAVGVLVLVQRVHYTADVLAAPPFAYATYWLARRLVAPALRSELR